MNLSKKHILITICDEHFSTKNLNSAVALYLTQFIDEFQKNGAVVEVYPNKNLIEHKGVTSSNKFKLVKKIIKKIVYKSYLNRIATKKLNFGLNLSDELKPRLDKFDLVIEFLTWGSSTYSIIDKTKKTKYLVIYDSPLATQWHEIYNQKLNANHPIIKNENAALLKSDAIIVYAESMKQYLLKNQQMDSNKIHCLPCILWKESTSENIEKSVIGFIGSFLKWHKVENLVFAFNELANDYPNIELKLIGYGQEWLNINKLVKKSPYHHRIQMPGFVDEKELQRLKNEMLVGVMPGSNWYGSPLKLFEYADAEIAIIAPNTPVVKDLFNAHEVLFIDEKNEVQSLVENIKLYLKNADLRKDKVDKAKEKMKTIYAKQNQMRNFIKLCNELIENGAQK